MSRMTQAELDALQSSAQDHNDAVAADVLDAVAAIEALEQELIIVDSQSAQVRDKIKDTIRIFKHKFDTEVQPLLGIAVNDNEPLDP